MMIYASEVYSGQHHEKAHLNKQKFSDHPGCPTNPQSAIMQKPGEATCGYPKPSRWLMQPAMAVQSGLHVCAVWSGWV